MLQHHVVACLRHLVVAVIPGIVAVERKGVALAHPDVAEGLEGIGFLIEIRTVAGEVCPFVEERHVAVEHLCTRRVAELVEAEHIGMLQIHPLVGFMPAALLPRRSVRLCQA